MHHIPESCSFYSVVSRANADIAHVRAKAKQEQVAYQASMRKEQMKVDSLERTLEQKVSSTSPVAVQWYAEMWNYLKYVNLCCRTKRLRSWLRSVMSWSLKWGRVSDYARSEKYQFCFTKRLMDVKDQNQKSYFSCWLCVQRSHGNGFLIMALYIFFFDVSFSVFCLKDFNIISFMSVHLEERTLLNYL